MPKRSELNIYGRGGFVWDDRQTPRFKELLDQGYSAVEISKMLKITIAKTRAVIKALGESASPTAVNPIVEKNAGKPEAEGTVISQRKMRTCNGPDCSNQFMSRDFGHRNCGCMRDVARNTNVVPLSLVA